MFYCPICGKAFSRVPNLKIHFKQHELQSCPICDAKVKSLPTHAYRMYLWHKCSDHAILWVLTNKIRYYYNKKLAKEIKEVAHSELTKDVRWELMGNKEAKYFVGRSHVYIITPRRRLIIPKQEFKAIYGRIPEIADGDLVLEEFSRYSYGTLLPCKKVIPKVFEMQFNAKVVRGANGYTIVKTGVKPKRSGEDREFLEIVSETIAMLRRDNLHNIKKLSTPLLEEYIRSFLRSFKDTLNNNDTPHTEQ